MLFESFYVIPVVIFCRGNKDSEPLTVYSIRCNAVIKRKKITPIVKTANTP